MFGLTTKKALDRAVNSAIEQELLRQERISWRRPDHGAEQLRSMRDELHKARKDLGQLPKDNASLTREVKVLKAQNVVLRETVARLGGAVIDL